MWWILYAPMVEPNKWGKRSFIENARHLKIFNWMFHSITWNLLQTDEFHYKLSKFLFWKSCIQMSTSINKIWITSHKWNQIISNEIKITEKSFKWPPRQLDISHIFWKKKRRNQNSKNMKVLKMYFEYSQISLVLSEPSLKWRRHILAVTLSFTYFLVYLVNNCWNGFRAWNGLWFEWLDEHVRQQPSNLVIKPAIRMAEISSGKR